MSIVYWALRWSVAGFFVNCGATKVYEVTLSSVVLSRSNRKKKVKMYDRLYLFSTLVPVCR